MSFFKTTALATVLGAACAGGAMAQGFDPRANCGQILASASDAEQVMIAAWTFGYIAANTDNVRPVDVSNNAIILKNIVQVCQANPNASLLDLVAASAQQSAPAAAAAAPAAPATPGSEADARAVLSKFLDPNANHLALTQALVPTRQEVMSVYAEPLGSSLADVYAQLLGPDVSFAPKTGQTDLLVIHTTTRALFDRKPVLGEFPGGYKEVVQYFKIDVPIVRFKFVKPGETSGYAFDGLIFLNGKWVIMPKPYRGLPG